MSAHSPHSLQDKKSCCQGKIRAQIACIYSLMLAERELMQLSPSVISRLSLSYNMKPHAQGVRSKSTIAPRNCLAMPGFEGKNVYCDVSLALDVYEDLHNLLDSIIDCQQSHSPATIRLIKCFSLMTP